MEGKSRTSAIACDFCRSKKYKCSKERPSCRVCAQHQKPCHYSAQIIRTPLTRAYLTAVENRLQKLEALFAKLLPNVNIEEALSSLSSRAAEQKLSVKGSPDNTAASENGTSAEALPSEATGFDWREDNVDVNELADGMAALSVDPSGKGYLGSTSGVVFLRSLLTRNRTQDLALDSPVSETAELLDMSSTGLSDGILSHELTRYLVDAYFSNYHTSYPFIHEATFRAQYGQIVPRPPEAVWQMLFYAVLALGAWSVGDEKSQIDDLCYRKAASYAKQKSIFETGCLSLVQATLLLSNYTQKRNKPNTGWNYLGLAVRMALSLGLHRELPEWEIGLLEREMRRRVWWGLFIFDSGASMTFGRAILLPENDMIDVRRVLNISDEFLTPMTTTVPSEQIEPTTYSSLIAQSQFHMLANSVSNRLLSLSPMSPGEALRLNDSLNPWKEGLPGFFRIDSQPQSSSDWYIFAREKLWWRFWNFQILLTRPFLLRQESNHIKPTEKQRYDSDIGKCRQVCIESAHATILSIQSYTLSNALTRLSSWYALFFLFHAALIPVACISAHPDSHDATSWQEDVATARAILEISFPENQLAVRCLEVLERLLPQSAVQSIGALWNDPRGGLQLGPDTWESDPFIGWPSMPDGLLEPGFPPE